MAESTPDSAVFTSPIRYGKYHLLERIASGGMAEVFKAKAYGVEGFERIVAVKRILPTIAENEEFTRMFVDEAKLAGQLQHANIAQIFDLGRVDDTYYIALEYVAGRDLRTIWDRVRQRDERLPVGLACHVIAKVLEGLDYAHNKTDATGQPLNIVHRDVSPQNMLVSYEGEVKLIDFGVAKAATSSTETRVGILKGKLSYMSPEQVRGHAVDRRSDVFTAGTVLYELLTGERLFFSDSDFETLEKIRKVEVAPPSLYNPSIPRDLEDIVLTALQKNPNHRFESAQDMHEALQRFMYTSGNASSARDLRGFMQQWFPEEIAEERARNEAFQSLTFDRISGEGAPIGGGLAWDETEGETQVFSKGEEAARKTGPVGGGTLSSWSRNAPAPASVVVRDDEATSLHASALDDAQDAALEAAIAAERPAAPAAVAAPARTSGPQGGKKGSKGGRNAPSQSPPAVPASTTAARPPAAADAAVAQAKPVPARPDPAPTVQLAPAKSGTSSAPGAGKWVALVVAVAAIFALFMLFVRPGAPTTGTLQITSEPPVSASVLIDGQPAHQGALPSLLEGVAAGTRSVSVRADGYVPSEGTVVVSAGGAAQYTARLVPVALPPLSVASTPPGATVVVNGAPRGVTPTQLSDLQAGTRYVIELSLAGHAPAREERVGGPSMAPVSVTLAPEAVATPVALEVTSSPAGARWTLVDATGSTVASGVTPGQASAPASASLQVRYELEGYLPATVAVTTGATGPTVATTTLAAAPAAATPAAVPADDEDDDRSAAREREEREDEPAAQPEPEPDPQPATSGAPGRLNVASRPAARLILDGDDTGMWTPIRGLEVAPGRHRVELVNEEAGVRYRETVTVEPGGEATVRNIQQ